MAVAAVRTSRIIEREREESGLVYILLLDSQSSSFASSPFLSSPSSILVRMLLFIMCPHLLSCLLVAFGAPKGRGEGLISSRLHRLWANPKPSHPNRLEAPNPAQRARP